MNISRYGLKLCALLVFLGAALNLSAQVTFELIAPGAVEAGKPFRIEYKLVSDTRPDSFNQPSFPGVDVIAGPTMSQGSNFTMINGNTASEQFYTYTYVLQASAAGVVNLPAASAVVSGKAYSSKTAAVEVVAGGAATSSPSTQQQPAQRQAIERDDIIVRAIVSNSNVYKGEPIRVSFKLYTRVQLAAIEGATYPAFNGFWTHELDASGYEWGSESYNDKVYQSRIISEYLLFPQQAGTLQIEKSEYTFVAQIVTRERRQSILDDFFGGPTVQQVRHTTASSPVRITVRNLPEGAPASFNGAVGKFTMEGGVSSTELTANSSANYEIKISGSGNLPLLNAPKLELPTSFEQYAVKTTDGYRASGSTITGNKQFSVPFIARAEGDYTIAPVEFSYFDPQAGRYNTLSIEETSLTVLPDRTGGSTPSAGIVSGISKEDLKILGSDIRFIRLGNPGLREAGSLFLWSWAYIVLLVLIVLAFIVALIYTQKQIKVRSNATLVRNKRAHKVAKKRLKAAENGLKKGNNKEFYEEMLKALWGYMSDKLNIPVADLSKSRIQEELLARGVDADMAKRYGDTIAECEFAQYAPAATTLPGDIYNVAEELISKLESRI